MLEFEQIKEIIFSDAPAWVEKARKEEKKLQVHVNGIGTAEYLANVTGFENKAQYETRKKFATSNKYLFENLLRPVDKVFSATGGSVVLDTSTDASKETLKGKLKNISGGYSLRKWIQQIQSNKYYTDPCGVVFFEWDGVETWPTFKSIHRIKNYETDGREIEWICFEPEKRKSENGTELPGEFYRVVDEFWDYTFYVVDKNITPIKDEIYENPFKRVPAIVNSNISDSTLEYFKSPIDPIVELADHYLRTNSVKNIYEFLHGYPIFWAVVEPCRTCDGTGVYNGSTCPSCEGEKHTFKKDVQDVLKVRAPETADQPTVVPNVAGYIQPDLETWREQRVELDWLETLMNLTMWGSTREQAENETATAAFIDSQPVTDSLNKFADAFEQTEQLLTDIIAAFYIRENYKGASVNYGRRFLIESPDKIWEKYEKSKEKGAPKSTLDYLLSQFYQSEFRDDFKSMDIALKSIKIEPFVHKTDEQVNSLPISDEDKKRKYYFDEFWKSLDRNEIVLKDVQQLEKEFEQFIINKNLSNGQEVQ